MNEVKNDKKETINKIDNNKKVDSKINNKVANKTPVKSGKEKKATSSDAKNKKKNNKVDDLSKSKVASTKVDAKSNTKSSVKPITITLNPKSATQNTTNNNPNAKSDTNLNAKPNPNTNPSVNVNNKKIDNLATNYKKNNEKKSKKAIIISSILLVLVIIGIIILIFLFGRATKPLATIDASAYVCQMVDEVEHKKLVDQGQKTFVPIEENKSYSIANISKGVLTNTQYIKVEYNIKNESGRKLSIMFKQEFTSVNNCQMTYFIEGITSEERPTDILIVDMQKDESLSVWFYVKIVDSSLNASFKGQITVNVAYRYGNE